MTLICFATFEEAESSLDLLKAKPVQSGLYQCALGFIAITGIGSFAAHVVTTALSESIDRIINIGLAGSQNKDLAFGSIHTIRKVSKFHWHPKGIDAARKTLAGTLPEIQLAESGLSLCTFDSPFYGELAGCDLVDMEGYGHAFAAQAIGKKCTLIKVVSDFCDKDSFAMIKTHLPELSKKMALYLSEEVRG